MGYGVYEDLKFPTFRWAGYGVPAVCDVSECTEPIDRGLAYRCEDYVEYVIDPATEEETEFGLDGCGLYFCPAHSGHSIHGDAVTPKPDTLEWVIHMFTAADWEDWRTQNPKGVDALKLRITSGA